MNDEGDIFGIIGEKGFHDLVAAFRATLAEARDADLLIHVSDAADEEREILRRVVNEVLEEIGAGDVPQLSVMNKVDLIDAEPRIDRGEDGKPRQVWLSAASGAGLDGLREALGELLGGDRIKAGLELPLSAGRLHARLKAAGAIAGEAVDEHGWHLDIDAPRSVLAPLIGDDANARPLRDLIDPPHAEF